jgi:hypothetical protein
LSYAVIDDIEKLNNPCKKIKSKWFRVDKNINRRVKDTLLSLVNKHKIDYIIYHGSYEKELFKLIRLKTPNIDLYNLKAKSVSEEEITCEFSHNVKDGREAHKLLRPYISGKTISGKIKASLENYNKEDVAKVCARFYKLIGEEYNTEAHKDKNKFIKLQRKEL